MAKKIFKTTNALPSLVKFNGPPKTGLEVKDLPKEEAKLIEQRFNDHLSSEVDKTKEDIINKLPLKKDIIDSVFTKISMPDFKEISDKPLNEILAGSISEEDKKKFTEEERKIIDEAINSKTDTIKTILDLEKPLNENTHLTKDIQKAKAVEIAGIIGLTGEKATLFANKELDIANISEAALSQLEDEKIITGEQKNDLFLTSRISMLSGENFDLVKAVKEKAITSPVDLVKWEGSDWLKLIKDKKISIPHGEKDPESYVKNLQITIERSFPTEYILHRTINSNIQNDVSTIIQKIAPVLNKNVELFSGDNHELSVTADELKSVGKDNLENAKSYTNMYRYLGVAEVLNQKTSLQEKQKQIDTRLNALNKFTENNSATINIATTDFATAPSSNTSTFNWEGVEAELRPLISGQMRAYQRAFILGESQENIDTLLKTGYDSALRIVSDTEADFISNSGLGIENGRKVYRKANDLAIGSAHYMQAIRGGISGAYNNTPVSNQQPLVNDLKQIDGFDDLFGNQDYCDCEQCRSVLSPAAYFTDLMYFVQENVSKRVFSGNLSHPLYLKNRRPDLWKLKLSCENTTTEIPYLSVVNDVLEKFLIGELDIINNVDELYSYLGKADLSINQPINLDLEELRLYLSHFGISLYDIYEKMQVDKLNLDRERMKISPEELSIITTPDIENVIKRFRNIPLMNFKVQDFESCAEISRRELDDLLQTKFITEFAQVSIKTIKDSSDIQKYYEEIQSLTDNRLDLLHRYLRLWKKTPWSLKEFDLILIALKTQGLLSTLEDKDSSSGYYNILHLARLLNLQSKLTLTVEELAAIINELPISPLIENKKGFAERIFNLDKIIHDAHIIDKTPFILAGLGISEAELGILSAPDLLNIDISKPITLKILCRLYKHARIAKALKITIEDLKNTMQLLNINEIINLDNIENIVNFIEWVKTTPIKAFEYVFILKGIQSTSIQYKNTSSILIQKVFEIQNVQVITGEDSEMQLQKKKKMLDEYLQNVFTQISDQLKKEFLLNLSKAEFESASTKALSANFNSTNKSEIQNKFDDLLNIIQGFERYTYLINKLQLKPATITYILEHKLIFGINDLKAIQIKNIKNILFYKELISENDEIEIKLQKMLIDSNANGNLTQNSSILAEVLKQPESLIISLMGNLNVRQPANSIGSENLLKSLLGNFNINQPAVTNPKENLLKSLQGGKVNKLANTPTPEILTKSLQGNLTTEDSAISTLRDLLTALKICVQLGIQGRSLLLLLPNSVISTENPEDLYHIAAQIALGIFSSKYDDEKILAEKLVPYTDKINVLKRDALCDYIISRYDKFKFKDRRDLYSFFMLDVEMSGCFRTTWLLAAITSVQLYIYRCLMNLEQSDVNLNPNILNIKVKPRDIPTDEWEWRKNYQVWVANRKVFLFPENYIDPTLRDTKSHIFKELEDELLQQKITKESAENAYKKYLSQFAELTRMRYAGAYYEQIFDNHGFEILHEYTGDSYYLVNRVYFPIDETEDSCYYLFARTNVMPYQYYYRTYNHYRKIWGNWIKIDLGIEAKEISTLIFQGKLYIFWTEVKSKEMTKLSGGGSSSAGFTFNLFVKYSFLNENGKWSAPQRISVGQSYDTNEKIYFRARNTMDEFASRWDSEKDAIIEKYQERVFRKPYSFAQRDITTPIGLSFIWTNEKSGSTTTYISKDFDYRGDLITNTGSILWGSIEFSIPSTSFIVENNNFSTASKVVSFRYKWTFINQSSNHQVNGTLTLNGAGSCTLSFILANTTPVTTLIFPVPLNVPTVDTSLPKKSTFNLSLSRNLVTNPLEKNIFTESSSIDTFLKEYFLAFSEDGDMATYIEKGVKDLSDHWITQDKNGRGGIHISDDSNYNVVPFNTILTDEITELLYAKGLEEFMKLTTQEITDINKQKFDFTGPYGEYYWEIFFHIPFLIADHFNANQKFKEAKWWYERIFNPTSEETTGLGSVSDHNWQFREFRGLSPQKLKDILTDAKAMEAYKKDPFDPHAIARLRISAYQKSIVMKYIDNLLDWGDYLFSQDTRESINEAEMLYSLAYNILGKKPEKVGKCETGDENTLNYESLESKIGVGSEFLITLENVYWVQKKTIDSHVSFQNQSKNLSSLSNKNQNLDNLTLSSDQSVSEPTNVEDNTGASTGKAPARMVKVRNFNDTVATQTNHAPFQPTLVNDTIQLTKQWDLNNLIFERQKRYPSNDIVKQSSIAFCVPENKDLLDYWLRVEDRLYKIWNCMNIKGIRRSLSLFQPPIDPMMLVRLRASGLSLEDVSMAVNNGSVPNYRFTYLIEKAKQYAQTVQGYGSSLLSALEKKDVEELLILRTVHEKNIQKLTTEIKKRQIKESQYQYKAIEEGITNTQKRVDYYNSLIETGLIPWEITEAASKWTASGIRTTEATLGFLASAFGFLPQLGNPFAMKYGGKELNTGTKSMYHALGCLAAIADNVAILAGLEASHQRREQEWKQQLDLAQQELKQANQQLLAAEIRGQIAERDLEIHEKSIEQTDEQYDFYKNKFTNLGLYNYMASSLNRIYREAYNIALDLAKLAEKAYQFERFDSNFYIHNDNWQFDKAGLLSGEKLLLQLQQLEKKHIETNYRIPEITQSFSLALLDSSQLMKLRQTGSCNIIIPEIAFEILYPGQYRRTIKSVSLTIPCITGPYTNISARLTLNSSKTKIKETDAEELYRKIEAKTTSITTSGAHNDSGIFNLNFNDERYLPFEGAGAIDSEWKLELPTVMRSFNYDTISDVILHLNYTALDGDRTIAENKLRNSIMAYATDPKKGMYRLFSLKHEFPNEFNKLFSQDAQTTDFTIEKQHFPYIFLNETESIIETKIYLKPTKDNSLTHPNIMINASSISWVSGNDIALPGSIGDKDKLICYLDTSAGDPVKKWTINLGTNTFNRNILDDILILIKYKI